MRVRNGVDELAPRDGVQMRGPMDSQHTHDKNLDAAHQIVAGLGRQAVSFRNVAARAGVSVGTVQYYFRSIDPAPRCADRPLARRAHAPARERDRSSPRG